MDSKNDISDLAHVTRHATMKIELALYKLIKQIRGCPYVGKVGCGCVSLTESNKKDSEQSGSSVQEVHGPRSGGQ